MSSGPAVAATVGVVDQAGARQVASIESLRAIGAVGVLVCHGYLVWLQAGGVPPDGLAHRLLVTVGSGYALLLVLSGYLLFRPFVRRLRTGAPADLGRYARNRALRVLPLYYVAVPVLLLTVAPAVGWERWLVLLTMTGNAVPGSYQGVNTPLLVLLVEVQFYLLLPVLVAGLRRRPTIPFAACVLLALCLVSVVARMLVLHTNVVADPERFVRASVLTMFHLFGAGMLLALLAEHLGARVPRGPAGSSGAWLAGAVGVWLLMLATGIEPLSALPGMLLLGAVVLPLRPNPVVAALSWRPLALVGVATFSLYMWHVPIAEALAASRWVPTGLGGYAVVYLTLVALVTAVSYVLVEAPALGLRMPWAGSGGVQPVRGPGSVLARTALGAALLAAALGGLATLR